MAPLWHWGLTDHHCGIIVPFQPHEQKQGPEPPAVGTRGQRDTPMVPSPPPPVVPEVIWGTPISVGAGCGAVPVPFPGKAAVFFGQTPTAPHHPMGLRCSWGAGGTRSSWGEVCTSARAPPLPSSSSSSPPKLSHLEAAEIWGHPRCHQRRAPDPGSRGQRCRWCRGGVEQPVAPPGEQDPAQLCCSHPAAEPAQGLGHICFGARGEPEGSYFGGGGHISAPGSPPPGRCPRDWDRRRGTQSSRPPGKGKALGSCSPLAPLPLWGGGVTEPPGPPFAWG